MHLFNNSRKKFCHTIQYECIPIFYSYYKHPSSKLSKQQCEVLKELIQSLLTRLSNYVMPHDVSKEITDIITDIEGVDSIEDTFHVVDVGVLVERFAFWQEHLPNVVPYYAFKTNNDKIIASILGNLGTGFDCASKNEIEQIINLGVDSSKIIFAHPRKPLSDIYYAKEKRVNLLTFDSIEELNKLLHLYPEADLLLRIKTDDSQSSSQLSQKFGATLEESYAILDSGFSRDARIIGIAFHVGSNCSHLESYQKALVDASNLFRYSQDHWNKELSLLNLGGGWPGTDDQSFIKIAELIKKLLSTHFPPQTKYMAEPGRFFAARTTTLVMKVLAKKKLQQENKIAYYLSNGVFGFFISSLYYEFNKEKILSEGWVFTHLASRNRTVPFHLALLWGPTCDSGDKIIDGILLPEMQTGDFLSVENMGAYTNSLETSFNGIPLSKPYYISNLIDSLNIK